ncbi:hypothetical protein ABZ816_41205 [Actinosynnema sp. NPDC047251]|uniref:Putative membrane protein n=1 Tax=Saccharothrix espanaensis (strain ATCC 51144 / DSM 44229 / JCM 9112 / NBRC 15066 / NRRL 15764) TaxID=1179773 RepID=K0JR08_SACES|nr:hypothetical protein [Saccharothrix espanaensis]CCH28181.1 putative membrane protein [Saccharothrix espanaensis DSM 44229]
MRERLAVGVLMVEAFVLAVLELFFLPMRLDGTLLPRFSDYEFPVTVLLALVTTPLLVVLASRYADRALTASAPLLVWFATLLFFALFGPGGDVVMLNDWRTLLLFAAGALPGAVALGAFLGRMARAGDH